MTARWAGLLALAAAAVALLLVVVLSGGDDDYKVRVEMRNADGLRENRPVRIGGAEVGVVDKLEVGPDDVVVADLALDADAGRIGEDASAQIRPTNLLGERFLDLEPGDLSEPQPSGASIPASRVRGSVDLDEVIDVLGPDARTRLGILINEAGRAFTGRRADFNALLRQLPPSLATATTLLNELISDNRTLGQLIERSERFVTRLNAERRDLSRMIDSAGQTMETVSARRDELRETFERAPGALATLRRFLAELRVTTGPLAPAARAITASAPALESTLAELEPFRQAAEPTLAQATSVAPELSRLGNRAAPVIDRSSAPLRSLTRFARTAAPLIQGLVHPTGAEAKQADERPAAAIDELLNITHTWAQAIQSRDAASHMFRGYVVVGPETMRQLVARYLQVVEGTNEQRGKRARRPASEQSPKREGERASTPEGDGEPSPDPLDQLLPQLDQLAPQLNGDANGLRLPMPKGSKPKGGQSPQSQLLDFLIKP